MNKFNAFKSLYFYISNDRLTVVHPFLTIPNAVIILPNDTEKSAKCICEIIKATEQKGFSIELLYMEVGKNNNIYPSFSY